MKRWIPVLVIGAVLAGIPGTTPEANAQSAIPSLSLDLGISESPEEVATTIQVIVALTVLSLAPAILIMTTCFTRLLIVFGFLRQALGTQQMPPNQLLVGLALFLTLFIMNPVLEQIRDEAYVPYVEGEITQSEGLAIAQAPVRDFMLRQTREKDLGLFVGMTSSTRPANVDELPMSVVIPAFVISELRIAFQIGFILYLPFLIIDMVVASVLMSMGMMMLPPIMISLPIKVLLFVLTDGWHLIVSSMVDSFH